MYNPNSDTRTRPKLALNDLEQTFNSITPYSVQCFRAATYYSTHSTFRLITRSHRQKKTKRNTILASHARENRKKLITIQMWDSQQVQKETMQKVLLRTLECVRNVSRLMQNFK